MIPRGTTSSPTYRSAQCSCGFAPTLTTPASTTSRSRTAQPGATPGGQWLLFHGQPDSSYVYWGTLFFSPGAAALRPLARGTSEIALYVRIGVSRGTVQVYRVTSAEISRVSELSLDLGRASDRERYDALLRSERQFSIEYCKL